MRREAHHPLSLGLPNSMIDLSHGLVVFVYSHEGLILKLHAQIAHWNELHLLTYNYNCQNIGYKRSHLHSSLHRGKELSSNNNHTLANTWSTKIQLQVKR